MEPWGLLMFRGWGDEEEPAVKTEKDQPVRRRKTWGFFGS